MRLPLLLILLASFVTPHTFAKSEQPNILLVLVDDMNDWVEPLGGNEQSITPNITRLAERSMLFTNAHTSSPACHPSRVALMTGVQPAKSGVTLNVFAKGEVTWRRSPALADVTTLSQHFRNHGYEAICGGKIYHTLQNNPSDENDYSTWDRIMPGDPKTGSPIPSQVRAKAKNLDFEEEIGLCPNRIMSWAPIQQDVSKMADHQLVDWAIEELQTQREQPLFLAVGIFRPHLPWEVPQEFFDKFPIDSIQLPNTDVPDELADSANHGRRHWHKWVSDNSLWKTGVQSYLASINFADYELGRLLEGLEASGQAENTIVVFWSDHGMHIGEKENWEKFTLFEEATRIPFLISDPRETPGSSEAPTTSIDLFPTLVELTDTHDDSLAHLDGESLADIVRGGNTDLQPAISTYKTTHAVRTNNFRYIYSESEGIEELYDHKTDPEEHTNRAYDPSLREVLSHHRHLLTRHTGVSTPQSFDIPETFQLQPNGTVRRKDYVSLNEVEYVIPNWWKNDRRQTAINRLQAQGLPFTQGEE